MFRKKTGWHKNGAKKRTVFKKSLFLIEILIYYMFKSWGQILAWKLYQTSFNKLRTFEMLQMLHFLIRILWKIKISFNKSKLFTSKSKIKNSSSFKSSRERFLCFLFKNKCFFFLKSAKSKKIYKIFRKSGSAQYCQILFQSALLQKCNSLQRMG